MTPRGPRPGRSRCRHRVEYKLKPWRPDKHPVPGAAAQLHALRDRGVRYGRQPAGATLALFDLPRRRTCSTKRVCSTRSTSSPRRASTPDLRSRVRRGPAQGLRGRSPRPPRRRSKAVTTALWVPAHRPFGLRFRGAVRWRIHHLQHLQHHRGTAQRASWRCCARWVRAGGRCSTSVIDEALVVGLFASLVGIAAGVGDRRGSEGSSQGARDRSAAVRRSSSAPDHHRRAPARMRRHRGASILPARRASRVAPVEAMRESRTERRASRIGVS